jgi:hypothetical protein
MRLSLQELPHGNLSVSVYVISIKIADSSLVANLYEMIDVATSLVEGSSEGDIPVPQLSLHATRLCCSPTKNKAEYHET